MKATFAKCVQTIFSEKALNESKYDVKKQQMKK